MVGKYNFELGKSECIYADPQNLLARFAGKSKPINNKVPGTPDYGVDFGELIGYYVNERKSRNQVAYNKRNYPL